MKTISLVSVTAMSAFLLGSSLSIAQENPTPSRSIESFKSWTVECTNVALPKKKAAEGEEEKPEEPKTRNICEVIQTYTNSKTGNEVVRLAFGYDGEDDKRKLVGGLRTLVDVSFDKSPEIFVGEKALVQGKMSRCKGIYCIGRFDMDDAKIKKLKGAKDATLQYPVSTGQIIKIKITLDGLNDALTALKTKEEKK